MNNVNNMVVVLSSSTLNDGSEDGMSEYIYMLFVCGCIFIALMGAHSEHCYQYYAYNNDNNHAMCYVKQ